MTGDFGPLTEQAVRTFQQHTGLSADGVMDATTWAQLHAAVTHYAGNCP